MIHLTKKYNKLTLKENPQVTNSEGQDNSNKPEKKKMTLEEAFKKKLAQKKQAQIDEKHNRNSMQTNSLKSQTTKKTNNQRRRTGV